MAAAALVGCGGTAESLTKVEYIARADAICADAYAELEALDQGDTAEEFAAYLAEATPVVERQIERLRELGYPRGDEETLERAIELTERQNDLARELGEAAASGDQARFAELLAEIQPLNDEADRIASQYGMNVCGRAAAEPTASDTGAEG